MMLVSWYSSIHSQDITYGCTGVFGKLFWFGSTVLSLSVTTKVNLIVSLVGKVIFSYYIVSLSICKYFSVLYYPAGLHC